MNIRDSLLADFRKPAMLLIADWIGGKPDRFAQLIDVFMGDEDLAVKRSAWVLSMVVDNHPNLVITHLAKLVARMQEEGHEPAVRRNIARILQFVDLPEDLHGIIMDACFRFAADAAEEIAVRACSLIVISRLATLYPEITPELQAVIEEGLEHGASPAFKASAKKALKMLAPRKAGT
jgi:hypothetical protein